MPKSCDRRTKSGARVSVPVSSEGGETDDLPHISSEITSLAMTAPEPPGTYWQGPSQHRHRAAQLRAQNPDSRAAVLALLAAGAIERRLRPGAG
jgi:hypothetical protein